MKILLSLIICSQIAGTCLDPYPWAETFDTNYECLKFGYEESLRKLAEIHSCDQAAVIPAILPLRPKNW